VQFEAGSEVLGPGLTVAIKLEKPREPPVSAEEGGKLEFELVKLQERFLVEQDFVGPWRVIFDQFHDADGLAVIERNADQIGIIANQPIFGAVLQAVDVSSNATFEVPLDCDGWQEGQLGVLGGTLDELADGFGGEGVGAKAVGQDATKGAAPMPAVNMASGVQNGLVEEKLPIWPELRGLHTVREQEAA